MGISYVQGTVRGPTGTEASVRFLIDSGATYSLLSECQLALPQPQSEGHTPVVLGQPGDAEALLGVVTLEILGLVFDPFRRTLQPMRMLLV